MYSSHTPSYYAIDLPSRNSNSLASALDLSKRDLFEVLQIVGGNTKLVKLFKGELVPGKAEAYHTFLVNTHELPISYIDKSTSKCCRQRNKQLLSIGLGMFDSENKNSRQVDQLYNYTPEFLAERMSLVLLRVLQDQWRLFYIQQRRMNPQKIKSLPQERDHGIVTRIQVIQRKQDEFLLVLQPPARIVLVLLLLQQHSLLMIRKKFGNRRQSKCGVTGWRD